MTAFGPAPVPEQREKLRKTCVGLRKLLAAKIPMGMLAILEDVGNIEMDSRLAIGEEFREVESSLNELIRGHKDRGVVTSRDWAVFLGEGE
jgi:hypothetical protein